jgi:hypothetical protein
MPRRLSYPWFKDASMDTERADNTRTRKFRVSVLKRAGSSFLVSTELLLVYQFAGLIILIGRNYIEMSAVGLRKCPAEVSWWSIRVGVSAVSGDERERESVFWLIPLLNGVSLNNWNRIS